MRHYLIALALCVVVTHSPRADEPVSAGGWKQLTGDAEALKVWKKVGPGWQIVGDVRLESKNPRKFDTSAGHGVLMNGPSGRAADLVTRDSYGDVELHVEFVVPKGSNSGVKFHAHYEIQLYDSYGAKNLTGSDCGGVYPRAEMKPAYHHIDKGIAPRVNASKAPGEWQTLDATFLAPRFGKDGKKTANARLVSVRLNGQVIHEDLELTSPTGHAWTNREVATGPLLFQGDHGPVAFRNVRVRPYVPADAGAPK